MTPLKSKIPITFVFRYPCSQEVASNTNLWKDVGLERCEWHVPKRWLKVVWKNVQIRDQTMQFEKVKIWLVVEPPTHLRKRCCNARQIGWSPHKMVKIKKMFETTTYLERQVSYFLRQLYP